MIRSSFNSIHMHRRIVSLSLSASAYAPNNCEQNAHQAPVSALACAQFYAISSVPTNVGLNLKKKNGGKNLFTRNWTYERQTTRSIQNNNKRHLFLPPSVNSLSSQKPIERTNERTFWWYFLSDRDREQTQSHFESNCTMTITKQNMR